MQRYLSTWKEGGTLAITGFNVVRVSDDVTKNVIKDTQWYAVQGSDTTMMTIAPFARTINK